MAEINKPECEVLGEDGNTFAIMARARKALKRAGQYDKAGEMFQRVTKDAKDYNEALSIIKEYVDLV